MASHTAPVPLPQAYRCANEAVKLVQICAALRHSCYAVHAVTQRYDDRMPGACSSPQAARTRILEVQSTRCGQRLLLIMLAIARYPQAMPCQHAITVCCTNCVHEQFAVSQTPGAVLCAHDQDHNIATQCQLSIRRHSVHALPLRHTMPTPAAQEHLDTVVLVCSHCRRAWELKEPWPTSLLVPGKLPQTGPRY
jgi:hypothetical protein